MTGTNNLKFHRPYTQKERRYPYEKIAMKEIKKKKLLQPSDRLRSEVLGQLGHG